MKSFKRLVTILLAALPLFANAAFDQCQDYFPEGRVPARQVEDVQARDLCFDSFAVLHSGKTKTPIYAVENLNRERLEEAKGHQRTNRFYEEARLPSRERAHLTDYLHSGYDRGHITPAGDIPNQNAMAQCFSLANMVPQVQHRGVRLSRRDDAYVFTSRGPADRSRTSGAGHVWVPDEQEHAF